SDWQRYRNRRDITFPVATRFKELMGEDAKVNFQIGRGGQTAIYRERRTNPNTVLIGTDENFITAFNFDITAGRNLQPDDVEFGRPVCLLGTDIKDKLFPNEDPIGRLIRINGQNYNVVGLLSSKGSAFG